jgi:hypothetical protein
MTQRFAMYYPGYTDSHAKSVSGRPWGYPEKIEPELSRMSGVPESGVSKGSQVHDFSVNFHGRTTKKHDSPLQSIWEIG